MPSSTLAATIQLQLGAKAIMAGTGSATDYDLELPMFDFPKDEYVLTVEVILSEKTARRALRFRVE